MLIVLTARVAECLWFGFVLTIAGIVQSLPAEKQLSGYRVEPTISRFRSPRRAPNRFSPQ